MIKLCHLKNWYKSTGIPFHIPKTGGHLSAVIINLNSTQRLCESDLKARTDTGGKRVFPLLNV